MSPQDLQKLVKEKFKFFFRVFKIARTWGLLNILKFVPYEIFYGLKYKVSTLFSLNHEELDVSADIKQDSTEYFPTPYYIARKVFKLVQSELRDCKFVDIGCGAGRILMFASEFNPKKVTGVEFSKKLCAQAKKNLNAHFDKNRNLSTDWEIVHANALEYLISPSANVFFFYDPFNAKTMRKMVEKINLSVTEYPRPITVIYISPAHSNVFIECGYKIIKSSINKYNKGYVVFHNDVKIHANAS